MWGLWTFTEKHKPKNISDLHPLGCVGFLSLHAKVYEEVMGEEEIEGRERERGVSQ